MVPTTEQPRIHQEINDRSRTNLDSCIWSRSKGIVRIYYHRMSMYRIVVDMTLQLKWILNITVSISCQRSFSLTWRYRRVSIKRAIPEAAIYSHMHWKSSASAPSKVRLLISDCCTKRAKHITTTSNSATFCLGNLVLAQVQIQSRAPHNTVATLSYSLRSPFSVVSQLHRCIPFAQTWQPKWAPLYISHGSNSTLPIQAPNVQPKWHLQPPRS